MKILRTFIFHSSTMNFTKKQTEFITNVIKKNVSDTDFKETVVNLKLENVALINILNSKILARNKKAQFYIQMKEFLNKTDVTDNLEANDSYVNYKMLDDSFNKSENKKSDAVKNDTDSKILSILEDITKSINPKASPIALKILARDEYEELPEDEKSAYMLLVKYVDKINLFIDKYRKDVLDLQQLNYRELMFESILKKIE